MSIIESFNFSGANESEVKGVEEEQNPLARVVFQADLLEFVLIPRHAFEMRSRFGDSGLDRVIESVTFPRAPTFGAMLVVTVISQ